MSICTNLRIRLGWTASTVWLVLRCIYPVMSVAVTYLALLTTSQGRELLEDLKSSPGILHLIPSALILPTLVWSISTYTSSRLALDNCFRARSSPRPTDRFRYVVAHFLIWLLTITSLAPVALGLHLTAIRVDSLWPLVLITADALVFATVVAVYSFIFLTCAPYDAPRIASLRSRLPFYPFLMVLLLLFLIRFYLTGTLILIGALVYRFGASVMVARRLNRLQRSIPASLPIVAFVIALAAASLLIQIVPAVPEGLRQSLAASGFGITLDELRPLITPIETLLPLTIATTIAYSMWFTRARNRIWVDQLAKAPEAFEQWIFVVNVFALLAFYAWVFLQTVRDSAYSRQIGTISVLLYALGLWQLVASLLFVFLPSRLGLPSLALLPILIFACLSNQNDNHSIDAKMNANEYSSASNQLNRDTSTLDFAGYLTEWLRSRKIVRDSTGRPLPYPVIVVSAEGGGLRAAYWTAAILSDLDRQTDGEFSQHVFALSGVSGGSLGIAAYAANLADSRDGAVPAKQMQSIASRNPQLDFLSKDFISPVLAYLLMPDLLQRFWPRPISAFDRARALESSLGESWPTSRFRDSFRSLWMKNNSIDFEFRVPAIFFNATQVESGKRYIVSNLNLRHDQFLDSYFAFDNSCTEQPSENCAPSIDSLSLATAVHLSARFPYLSPAAAIYGTPSDSANNIDRAAKPSSSPSRRPALWGRVVDGGYFENSGAGTAEEIIRSIRFLLPQVLADPTLNDRLGDFSLDIFTLTITNAPTTIYDTKAVYVEPLKHPREADGAKMLRWKILADYLHEVPPEARPMFATSDLLSELLTPPEAVLSTINAHENVAQERLNDFVNQQSSDFVEYCCSPEYRTARSLFGWSDPCKVNRRSVVFSLGNELEGYLYDRVLRGPLDRTQTWEPGLGWYLSKGSRDSMDVVIDKLHAERDYRDLVDILLSYLKGESKPATQCNVEVAKSWVKAKIGTSVNEVRKKFLERLRETGPSSAQHR
jgi:hypothetical protein